MLTDNSGRAGSAGKRIYQAMISDQQQQQQQHIASLVLGSHDGEGAADHDQPYRFGRRPRTSVPYPFSTRQYLHLLVLRGRFQDGLVGADDVPATPQAA